eukprot:3391853-Rhodomonas_salina.3
MRREGFELGVCPPKVLYQKGDNGERLEPIEEVVVEVDEEYSGAVVAAVVVAVLAVVVGGGGGDCVVVVQATWMQHLVVASTRLACSCGRGGGADACWGVAGAGWQ